MATLRTNTNAFKEIIDNFLFEHIDNIDEPKESHTEVARYSKERFENETRHDKRRRLSTQHKLADWLRGLPFQLPYWNEDVINLAKSWGTLAQDATEKQEQKIVDNYYNFMAFHIMKYWEHHGVA